MASDTSENGKQISLKEKASTILQAVQCTKVNSLMVRERDKGLRDKMALHTKESGRTMR